MSRRGPRVARLASAHVCKGPHAAQNVWLHVWSHCSLNRMLCICFGLFQRPQILFPTTFIISSKQGGWCSPLHGLPQKNLYQRAVKLLWRLALTQHLTDSFSFDWSPSHMWNVNYWWSEVLLRHLRSYAKSTLPSVIIVTGWSMCWCASPVQMQQEISNVKCVCCFRIM